MKQQGGTRKQRMAATAHVKQPGVDVTVVVTARDERRKGERRMETRPSAAEPSRPHANITARTNSLTEAALQRPARVLAKALRLQGAAVQSAL